MLFWALSIGFAALALLPVLAVMLRGGAAEGEAADLAIYRDQLAEVARDRARGLLDEAEAGRVELEVQRRLLDAGARHAPEAGRAPRWVTWTAVSVVAVAGMGGALALYAELGAPGYPDLPLATRLEIAEATRASRVSQPEAEARAAELMPAPGELPADFTALMERLRAALETRPDDVEGFRLLARNEAASGDFVAARRARARVVEILGDAAGADDLSALAEAMILAAGGFVTPEAEARLDAALARAPGDGLARYYKGLAMAQIGRPDVTFGIWRALLEDGPAGAPWIAPVEAQIEGVAARAGIRYDAPPPQGAPGPDAAQVAGAGDMDPAARQEMIEGMVAGLAERLATEGGPAPDWARLITAYGVLGRTDTARRVYAEAQEIFASNAEDLALVRGAAERAGIAR